MVAWRHEDEMLGEGFVELRRRFDEAVEVSTFPVFGSALAEVSPPVPLALHCAVEVSDVQDASVPFPRLLQVQQLQPVVAVSVVVVAVRTQQEVLAPVWPSCIEVHAVASLRGLLHRPWDLGVHRLRPDQLSEAEAPRGPETPAQASDQSAPSWPRFNARIASAAA